MRYVIVKPFKHGMGVDTYYYRGVQRAPLWTTDLQQAAVYDGRIHVAYLVDQLKGGAAITQVDLALSPPADPTSE